MRSSGNSRLLSLIKKSYEIIILISVNEYFLAESDEPLREKGRILR